MGNDRICNIPVAFCPGINADAKCPEIISGDSMVRFCVIFFDLLYSANRKIQGWEMENVEGYLTGVGNLRL
jgi:hypothetical protein